MNGGLEQGSSVTADFAPQVVIWQLWRHLQLSLYNRR